MAKKRKTRRQKIIAATHRNVLENTLEILPRISLEEHPTKIYTPDSKIYSYSYVVKDARKTLLIITIIAVLNIALFFMLKLKIVSLFGLVF